MQTSEMVREDKRGENNDGILNIEQLDRYRWEAIQKPAWREEGELNEDYYDSNQLNAQVLQDLEDRGIPPIVVNLTAPTVDLILGMEAKTRTDWVVRQETQGNDDLALALSVKLKEAERMTKADEACAAAYADVIKGPGIGWVEVSRHFDPFQYKYRVSRRDWREFWWDMHADEDDLSDANYLIRRRFYDRSFLTKLFKNKADIIKQLGPGYTGQPHDFDGRSIFEPPMYSSGLSPWRDYSTTEYEWVDVDRDRLQLEEVWYRYWDNGVVLETRDGQVVEYDDNNPLHAEAANRGLAEVRHATFARLRMSFWIGPERLLDKPAPPGVNNFPYIPVLGYKEGRTRTPYSMVRRMRPLQDEINARRSKMLWGLSASRVIVDDDAVDDHDQTRLEVSRRDAYIVLNKDRQPQSKFDVDDNMALNQQQYNIYADSKQTLQDAGGVYQSMLGKKDSGADSGVAIDSLVEQGTMTLANVNSKYKTARSNVGQALLDLITVDLAGKESEIQVDGTRGKKTVYINRPAEKHGVQILENDVTRARMKVTLDNLPSSPTFRTQQYMRMAELVKVLPPDMQAQMLDMVVAASDVPNKEKFVERIREMAGIQDPESMNEEELAAYQQKQEKAAMEEQLVLRERMAAIKDKEASAMQKGSTAELNAVRAQLEQIMGQLNALHKQAETGKTVAQTEEIQQDMDHQDVALAANGPNGDEKTIYHR